MNKPHKKYLNAGKSAKLKWAKFLKVKSSASAPSTLCPAGIMNWISQTKTWPLWIINEKAKNHFWLLKMKYKVRNLLLVESECCL